MKRGALRGWLAVVATTLAAGAAATQVLPEGSLILDAPRPFAAIPPLPDLNWADLPIKLTAQDSVNYTDNVFGLPTQPIPGVTPRSRGDFYNLTLLGATGKYYWDQQKFNFNAAYGITRYATDVEANSTQYNINAGWNWAFTSRCTGTLTAAISKLPSVTEEQVGFGINEISTQAYNETAKCMVWGGFSLLANSGRTSARNSTTSDQALGLATLNRLLDYDSKYVAGGVGYDWSALDNSQLLYRHTDRVNPNRVGALATFGLANEVIEDDVTLSYQRFLSTRLDASVSAGLTRLELISDTGAGNTSTVAPHYSLGVNWRPTDKLSLQASVAHTIGAPTTLLANAQVSDTASLSAVYALSSKTSLNAGVSVSKSTGAFLQQLSGSPFSQQTDLFSARVGATYQMTPFFSGNVTYQYSDRKEGGFDTVVNRVIVSMSYAPY